MIALAMPQALVAQPGANPLNGGNAPYAPNYYNRNSQPLSPYLNLLRGGNPAVNYFYGVRPGLMNGAFASPLDNRGGNMNRQTFFPQVDTLTDPENVNPLDGLRPTGHQTGFGNTLNYFGAGSMPSMGSRQAGGPNAMGRGPAAGSGR
jgi:hypothetical protein